MKHLTMQRDNFIASVLLLGFKRTEDGARFKLDLSPNRRISILHSAKDVTIYVRYGKPYQPPGMRKQNLGNPKKFKHDNRKALDWLANYIDSYRSKIYDPPDPV